MTLIELVVAIGIFGLVSLVIFGIFILATGYQRRIVAVKNVEDNLRFAIESMSREIRTGRGFVKNPDSSLSFINAEDPPKNVVYRLYNGMIEKSIDNGSTYLQVTGSEVTIDYLTFVLAGQQPRITIAIGATSKVGTQSSNLKVQTTISSRLLKN